MKKLMSIVIVLLTACQSSTAPDPQELSLERYFPLAVENIWIYRNENGSRDTTEIISTYPWDNKTVYITNNYEYFYYDRGDLVMTVYEPPHEAEYYYIRLSEPLEIGHKWGYTNYWVDTLHISQINVTINTEMGPFENCLQVDSQNEITYYYALDVGLVKVEDSNEEWNIGKELIWYNLKK